MEFIAAQAFLQETTYSYGNILPRNYLSYIFEIWENLSWCSPLQYGKDDVFPENYFHGGTYFVGKIYRAIVLHEGTNNQIMPKGKEFHKMHFPVI